MGTRTTMCDDSQSSIFCNCQGNQIACFLMYDIYETKDFVTGLLHLAAVE